MRELTFIGPLSGAVGGSTPEVRRLLLISEDGTEFQLKVDQRIVSVITREFSDEFESHRAEPKGSSESSATSLRPSLQGAPSISPREIQDRVRSGESPRSIASESGADFDYVNRFASQVLAEMDEVVNAARQCAVTNDGQSSTFERALQSRLRVLGVDLNATLWDAHKVDGVWTVTISYVSNNQDAEAVFEFSLSRKTITPANEEAEWLVAQPHHQDSEADETLTPRLSQPQAAYSKPEHRPEPRLVEATPSSRRDDRSENWDAEHPAAKALKKREETNKSSHETRQASQEIDLSNRARQPESTKEQSDDLDHVNIPTQPAHSISPGASQSFDETSQTSPEWEDLLFGTPDNEA